MYKNGSQVPVDDFQNYLSISCVWDEENRFEKTERLDEDYGLLRYRLKNLIQNKINKDKCKSIYSDCVQTSQVFHSTPKLLSKQKERKLNDNYTSMVYGIFLIKHDYFTVLATWNDISVDVEFDGMFNGSLISN
jgi:hypothetical protein